MSLSYADWSEVASFLRPSRLRVLLAVSPMMRFVTDHLHSQPTTLRAVAARRWWDDRYRKSASLHLVADEIPEGPAEDQVAWCRQLAAEVEELHLSRSQRAPLPRMLECGPFDHIRVLHLSATLSGDAGASALANVLSSFPVLEALDLSRNGIGVRGMSALAPSLTDCARHCLKILNLNDNQLDEENGFSDTGVSSLLPVLSVAQFLEELMVAANVITSFGAAKLFTTLAENKALLRTLNCVDASRNRIGDGDGCVAINTWLRKQQCPLQRFLLQGNTLSSSGATLILEGLQHAAAPHSMKTFNFYYNDYERACVVVLSTTLSLYAACLRELQLTAQRFDAQDAEVLCAAVASLTNLQVLNLGDNSFGDRGALPLATALQQLQRLTWVSLSGNRMGNTGCELVVSALAASCCRSLRTLDLSGSWMGDGTAKNIALRVYDVFCNMEQLLLQRNRITNSGATLILQVLQHHPRLQEVHLDGQPVEEIVDAVRRKQLELRMTGAGGFGGGGISRPGSGGSCSSLDSTDRAAIQRGKCSLEPIVEATWKGSRVYVFRPHLVEQFGVL